MGLFLKRFAVAVILWTGVLSFSASAANTCSALFDEAPKNLPLAVQTLLQRIAVVTGEPKLSVLLRGRSALPAEIARTEHSLVEAAKRADVSNFDFYSDSTEVHYKAVLKELQSVASQYLRAIGVSHILEKGDTDYIYIVPSTESPLNQESLEIYRKTGGLLRISNERGHQFAMGAFNFKFGEILKGVPKFDEYDFADAAADKAKIQTERVQNYKSAESLKIFTKLQRVHEQTIPKVLEYYSRVRSGTGYAPNVEYAKGLLKADNIAPTAKPSAVARQAGFKTLSHVTSVKALVGMLSSGSIQITKEGTGARAVYTELFADDRPPGAGYVKINLRMELLDTDNYFSNPWWGYGSYSELSVSPLANRGRLEYYLRNLREHFGNEFVFITPIDVRMIESIYVDSKSREAILAQLSSVTPPNGIAWEQLVRGLEP